ncbi:MAG: hypothetical protein Q8R78_03150 [Candidatus Omnitrophota bacterium]|nr:hypothetical protein [Candidatus Omnitrophota bacterium]
MPQRGINPAELDGEALQRWYLRSPEEIEQERRATADALQRAFFGGERSEASPFKFDMADKLPQHAQSADEDGFRFLGSWGQGRNQGFAGPDARGQNEGSNWPGRVRPVPLPSPRLLPASSGIRAVPLPSPRPSQDGLRPVPLARADQTGFFAATNRSTTTQQARPVSYPSGEPTTQANRGPQPSGPASQRHAGWINGRQPGAIDPSKTEVFQNGPDGRLQPVPGWRTTGPFEFGKWSRMFDWGGVAGDLTDITTGALDFMAGGGLAGQVVKGLGYKIGPDVVRGIIESHHGWPKFMGGPSKQELADLYNSIHTMYHGELAAALKQAGFPRIGGRGGGTKDWAFFFVKNPARQDEALEILRRVTRDFDKRNNTKISGYLDGALAKGKPSTSPPPD